MISKTASQSPKQLTIELKNVGPHDRLALTFEPGVNVLKGRNGVGKSTAIEAVTTALGGDGIVTVRDGAVKGTVEVDGTLVLSVGRTVNRKGQPSVELGGYSPISDVIDPGIIDAEKADARRIKAILAMAPVPVTDAIIDALTSGSEDLKKHPPPDDAPNILAVAEHYRKKANEIALGAEKHALVCKAQSDAESAKLASMGAVPTCSLGLADAEILVARADRHLSQVALLAEQRREAEERHTRIAATLGERPKADDGEAEKLDGAVEVIEAELDAIEKRASEMRALLAKAVAERDAAWKAMNTCVAAQAQWDAQKKALDEPIKGPTREDVVAAEKALTDAQRVAEDARKASMVKTAQDAIGKFLVDMQTENERVSEFRGLASAVSERLGEILARAGLDGLDVEDRRLYVKLDGKRQLFADRLSFGQRARIALTIGLRAFKGRVIPVKPEFWTALQPKFQKELDALAVDMGCVLVTEQATDADAITVERA